MNIPQFDPPKPQAGHASWAYDNPLRLPEEWENPEFTYRWVRTDPRDIRRRESQGFVVASNVNGTGESVGNDVDTTRLAGGELVLMAAYKEVAEEYNDHLHKQVDSVEKAITRNIEEVAPQNDRTGQRAEVRQRLVIE